VASVARRSYGTPQADPFGFGVFLFLREQPAKLGGGHKGRGTYRSGPWALGSELIANVVRVDYPTHVATATDRQLRPHVLALLASSRWRLGGPIVRCLFRESLNPGHRHGFPNAWAAIPSPCLADYILQGHFRLEAVRRRASCLGGRRPRAPNPTQRGPGKQVDANGDGLCDRDHLAARAACLVA
jgi:hypothetical protein